MTDPIRFTITAALAIVLACGAASAQQTNSEFDTSLPDVARFQRSGTVVPADAAGDGQARTEPAPAVSGEADLSRFFLRLESIGLDTKEIRAIAGKMEVFFTAQRADAAAEWGYILDNMYLPHHFAQPGTKTVRFDLGPADLETLLHEFVHAARDVSPGEKAPKGTPSYHHFKAVEELLERLNTLDNDWIRGVREKAAKARLASAAKAKQRPPGSGIGPRSKA